MNQCTDVSLTCSRIIRELSLLTAMGAQYFTLGSWLENLSSADLKTLQTPLEEVSADSLTAVSDQDLVVITMMLMDAEGEDVVTCTDTEVDSNVEYLRAVLLPMEELRRQDLVMIDYSRLTFAVHNAQDVICKIKMHA